MQKSHIIFFIFTTFLLSSCSSTQQNIQAFSNTNNTFTPSKEDIAIKKYLTNHETATIPKGDYSLKNQNGSVYIEGYIETITKSESTCEESCETFDQVVFQVTKHNNSDLQPILQSEKKLTLGCRKDNYIEYIKHENDKNKIYNINPVFSEDLFASNAENRVLIQLAERFTSEKTHPCQADFDFKEVFTF